MAVTPRSAVSRALWSQGVVALATILALILQHGLGVERASMLYFASVLICAAWLGVWYGLLAAITATVAFNVASTGGSLHFALGSKQDFVNLIVYATGAWVAGLYVDERRRERDALLALTRPTRDMAVRNLISRARDPASLAWAPLTEVLRIAAAVVITVASIGIGSLVLELVGPASVSMFYLAGVVLSGSMLGARYALLTALGSVVAYDYFVVSPPFTFNLDSTTAGVNLIVFLAVGWQVGRFAERTRYERRAVRSLFDAGRGFSATADEGALRRLMAQSTAAVTGARYVVVRDESGAISAEFGTRPADAPPGLELGGSGKRAPHPWRIRVIGSEANTLGTVAWLPATVEDGRPLEATAEVLIDLGGAAVARSRLSAEHLRLEAVAQAEQLRRALLASVSHDLRTPLAGILGSATSLLDHSAKYTDAVRRDLLMNIREQAHRLNRYVENLLGMTRLEAGTLQPQLQPVPLEAIVLESWEAIAEAAGATRTELKIDEDLQVIADPVLLKQVLTNLLENAVKFSPIGSTVQVTSREVAGSVLLTVRDQGIGISDDEMEVFFQPFVRGANSKAGGVGLGLFIARSFLEAMGGAIKAKARADGRPGLALEVTLPAAETVS